MSSRNTRVLTLILTLVLLLAGCSRQPAVATLDDPGPDLQQLPFERAPNRRGLPPTSSVADMPAGTVISVRLETPLSSASSHEGEAFEGVLDDPIVVRGKVVASRGTMVAGRVVAAKASDGQQTSGYLRLTLSAIALHGRSQAIQTSSLFEKGGSAEVLATASIASPPNAGAQDVELDANSRLTFRLQETVVGQP